MSPPARRLATVLFLDIVGSTHVASDLGDARWRTLLSRFRKVVGSELRTQHGHEENFTGDGFLATFSEPAKAITAGVGIARSVQDLGIDVRVGLHTGEVETIEGHLGGVAVHIGARVMSLAGPAEVLVTSTVKDLVHGSAIGFEEVAAHELKGVPGTWQIVAVRSIDGVPVPGAIDPADALARLETIDAEGARRGRRGSVLVSAAVLAVAGALAWVAFAGGGSGDVAAPSASRGPETSLVKLDATTVEIASTVEDGLLTDHLWGAMSIENGTLFQWTPSELRTRNLESGELQDSFELGDDHVASSIGFGSEWLGSESDSDSISRVDLVSGEVVETLDVEGGVSGISVGPDALWFVSTTGALGRVDPITLDVKTWPSGAFAPRVVVPFPDYVWICDCDNRQIIRFEIATQKFTTFDIPQEAYLVGPTKGRAPDQLWLVDQDASTVTPLDPQTGERGRATGFGGVVADAEIGFGKVWVAAAETVYVLDENDDEAEVISVPMPPGFFASSVALDVERGTVWIGTCGCPFE